jgi:hypothetical protein
VEWAQGVGPEFKPVLQKKKNKKKLAHKFLKQGKQICM